MKCLFWMAENDDFPILYGNAESLKEAMQKINFRVEFVGKPKSLEGLVSKNKRVFEGVGSDDVLINTDDESLERIRGYIKSVGADGALMLSHRDYGSAPPCDGDHHDRCDLVLIGYILKPLNG